MCQIECQEWDFRSRFDDITDHSSSREYMDEIQCCEFWEYARESTTLRNLNQYWESISEEIPSALHNCYFPLLNTASLPFPDTPWLSLTDAQRRDFQSQFFRKGVIPLPSLDIAEARIATIKQRIPKNQRRGYVFFTIDPSAWRHLTDKQLAELVSASIPRWRPGTIGEPADPQIGRAYGDTLARLRWLAAMRLYTVPPGIWRAPGMTCLRGEAGIRYGTRQAESSSSVNLNEPPGKFPHMRKILPAESPGNPVCVERELLHPPELPESPDGPYQGAGGDRLCPGGS